MLSLWFWVLLWLISTYWLVRVVGKPIMEATREQRAAAYEAAQAAAAEEAAAQAALLAAQEATDLAPLWLLLESLTPGLSAAEIQERLGVPEHVEPQGAEPERWRYSLRAEGEDGVPVSGTLLLDLIGGLLAEKAFAPLPAPSETEASSEASVSQAEPVDPASAAP